MSMLFCNINFNQKNKSDLLGYCENEKTKVIIPVNAALIVGANFRERFFDILNNNYVTFDGQIPYFVACLFNGKYQKYIKLAGSDIVYDFSEFAAKKHYKMFFLGGKKESNQTAVNVIKEKYNISIEGYSPDFEDYPFSEKFNIICLEKINIFKPDILFVGFGAPKQEYWIDDNIEFLSENGVKYAIGCGGTFDFVSQKIKRAPVFFQKIGLEGLYRLYQEPSKMRWNRLIDSCRFFKYIWHKPEFENRNVTL
ncbi:MAG: WecB/TagA/CpsF family glycosyltransferase [Treponema sp.]|jgi:N-acetylglucosaminyldiphosphoundecaprenol N-acetyl-beta-D-mannosaminyltransferase|nr:WecB/TagA/CpsF family glycosyltransferase [Treponema sp.]